MAVPSAQVKKHINDAISTAIARVSERTDELFTSEISSSGNGTASPFHKLLFPEARIFSSFERSLSASLGKAFDYISAAIAKETYGNGEHDHHLYGKISTETLTAIEGIVARYKQRLGAMPNTLDELETIRPFVEGSAVLLDREVKSDVFFVDHEGFKNYLEIKTPMPNYDQCASMKTRILTLYAMRFADRTKVRALAVFPHNPNGLVGEYAWPPLKYFLDPTHDWFARDHKLMGPGLWNFIGNSDRTYDELLELFYEVSEERKSELRNLLTITGE
jgi:hypothetical protein